MIKPQTKIAIGIPRGSDTRYHYEWILSLFKMFGKSPCSYKLISESKVHHVARNNIIQKFLKTDMEYLLFIDSDIIWEPDSLELAYDLIQNSHVDIVTGIYFTKNEPHLPVIKKLDLKAGCYDNYENWGNKPFEVDGAGMGFMLIPRYVLEKMKQPMCEWKGGFAEDLNFCLKAKKDHEFRIWAHPGIKVGHVSKTTITNFDWAKQHKPSIAAWMRENKRFTTITLKRWYPNWREELGIHPLQYKNLNTKKYWDDIYAIEGKDTWRTYPEKHEYLLKLIEKLYSPSHKFNVLELGCGVGVFGKKLISAFPKVDYYGVDISEVAVEECKKAGLMAEARQIPPVLPKGYTDGHFELVVGLELLEHLDDKPRLEVIKQVAKISKNAIFSIPDNCMPPEDVPEHRVMYDKKGFEKFLKQAFKEVRVESIVSRPSHLHEGREQFLIGICSKGGDKK